MKSIVIVSNIYKDKCCWFWFSSDSL